MSIIATAITTATTIAVTTQPLTVLNLVHSARTSCAKPVRASTVGDTHRLQALPRLGPSRDHQPASVQIKAYNLRSAMPIRSASVRWWALTPLWQWLGVGVLGDEAVHGYWVVGGDRGTHEPADVKDQGGLLPGPA